MYSQLETLESYLEYLNTKGDLPYNRILLPKQIHSSDNTSGKLRSIDMDLERFYRSWNRPQVANYERSKN